MLLEVNCGSVWIKIVIKNCNLVAGEGLKGGGLLKRQSSSGSDDGLGGSGSQPGNGGGKLRGERWSSLEDLATPPTSTQEVKVQGDQETIRRRRKHRATNKPGSIAICFTL